MKIFLSAIETQGIEATRIIERGAPMLWCLMSYYYLRSNIPKAEFVRKHAQEVLIDSGAHSFQKGKKVDWVRYTHEYAEFIRKFDRPNVLGYFEMDVDNVLGYRRVRALRRILEAATDKIIPVWHRNRGIPDYIRMCEQYAGRVVAITGFKNWDITDEQYMMFLKTAWKHGCKLHCLGQTRTDVLDRVPFDYTDSSSWKLAALYGRVHGRHVSRKYSHENMEDTLFANYLDAVEMQINYYEKWRNSNERSLIFGTDLNLHGDGAAALPPVR